MTQGGEEGFVLALSADEVATWRASQRERGARAPPFFNAPFYPCHALSRDAAHCARVAAAVARGGGVAREPVRRDSGSSSSVWRAVTGLFTPRPRSS